jgi:DNA topoisomerase-1
MNETAPAKEQTAAASAAPAARRRLTIRRMRAGRGFRYVRADGRRIRDPKVLDRLARLAVPPAYDDVVYAASPSADLQAMGRDAAGRWQYRYHSDWEKVRERRKAKRLLRLLDALPRIRRHVTTTLATREVTRDFAMAAAIALIDISGLRSGTSRHVRLSGARGGVSLLKSNVTLAGNTITLRFRAKGGKNVVKEVPAPRLIPAIKVLMKLRGPRLFAYQADGGAVHPIRVREVNAFLCEIASCKISLKDFRTLRASLGVLNTLLKTERGGSERRRKRQIKEAVAGAAEELSNTPAVCRRSYVHASIVDAFEDGALPGQAGGRKRRMPSPKNILAEVVAATVGP